MIVPSPSLANIFSGASAGLNTLSGGIHPTISDAAGASTCLGAAIVFLLDSKTISKALPFCLSLAASVMITVSCSSILPASFANAGMGVLLQRWISFGMGCGFYILLSYLMASLPDDDESVLLAAGMLDDDNNHNNNIRQIDKKQISSQQPQHENSKQNQQHQSEQQGTSTNDYWRLTTLLFVSLLLHNFPEGLAVAASASQNMSLGWTVTIGIMMHNIPEGIAIAIPCMVARPKEGPWFAFGLASLSGLAEPIGAFLAVTWLLPPSSSATATMTTLSLENILAGVAGIMCMVAIMDLYPQAVRHSQQYQEEQLTFPTNATSAGTIPISRRVPLSSSSLIAGTLVGITVMLVTEWALAPAGL